MLVFAGMVNQKLNDDDEIKKKSGESSRKCLEGHILFAFVVNQTTQYAVNSSGVIYRDKLVLGRSIKQDLYAVGGP